jgi:hypothetical protein
MGKVTPITEQFQHFVEEVEEGFWGDLSEPAQAWPRRPTFSVDD